jgi:hypothetical protein
MPTRKSPSPVPNTQDSPEIPLPESPQRRRSTFREAARRPVPSTANEPSNGAQKEATAHPQPNRQASRQPRHRAEPVRNRRTAGSAFRQTVALSCASAIMGVTALGAVAASADSGRDDSTSSTSLAGASSVAAADTLAASVAEAEADTGPTVTSELSVAAAPFTGGTQVSVAGEHLDEVASITVGGSPATIVATGEEQLTFAVPAVDQSVLGTAADVRFADAAGQPIEAEAPTAVVAAGTSVVQPLAGELTGILEPKAPTAPRSLTLTYTSDPAIDAQLAYVLTYWSDYNSGVYPVISGYDCANFASQSLLARGWSMDAGWNLDLATGAMTPSWASSTALRDYLNTRTDRATALDDSQRGLVKVGDIAQFDWDDSGDRDHTAIVTRVEHTASGSTVWVGGHTKDADFWDVDTALATGGGSVSYFSIR